MQWARALVAGALSLAIGVASMSSTAQASPYSPAILLGQNSYAAVYVQFLNQQTAVQCGSVYSVGWIQEYFIPPTNTVPSQGAFDIVGLNCSGRPASRTTNALGPCLNGNISGLPLPAPSPGLTAGEQAQAYLYFLVQEAHQCLGGNFSALLPAYNIYPKVAGAAGPCLTAPNGPSCQPPPAVDPRVLAARDAACSLATGSSGTGWAATFVATVAAARGQRTFSTVFIGVNALLFLGWAAKVFQCVVPVRTMHRPEQIRAAWRQPTQAGLTMGQLISALAPDCDIPRVEVPERVLSAFRGVSPEERRALRHGLEADGYALATDRAANRYMTALQHGDSECAERQLDAYLRYQTRGGSEFKAFQQDLYGIAAALQGTPDDTVPTTDEVNAVLQTFFVKDLNAFDPREILIIKAYGVDPTWTIPNLFGVDPSIFVQAPSAALKSAADAIASVMP